MKNFYANIAYRFLSILMLALGVICFLPKQAAAQNDVITHAGMAIRQAGARELVKLLNDGIEITIDDKKASYSHTQAEYVLRNFFKLHPPQKFVYIHQGSSKEGLRYAIGRYTCPEKSYRVYMVIKLYGGQYLIDTLNFSEEDVK